MLVPWKTSKIERVILAFCAILLSAVACMPAAAEPIPENVSKCVVYLTKPENTENVPIGTGFFVGYKYGEQNVKYYVFLVTAKHVLFDEKGVRHPRLLLRMNEKATGHLKDFDVLKPNLWFFHKDAGAVDIAVQPLLPKDADFLFVRSDDFTSKELLASKKIGLGDDVFYTGLLSYHAGRERIAPVVRFGRLALTTNEKTVDGKYYHFIDAGNIPGHSGSPIFLWATPTRESSGIVAGPRIFGLYGIVSGVLEYTKELRFQLPKQTQVTPIPLDFRSGGITAIVPVKYLVEILESPELVKALAISATKK